MARLTQTITAIALSLTAPFAWADRNEDILRRYVEDYRSDPMLVNARFGIKVGEQWWHVASRKGAQGQPNEVVLSSGQPAQPTWFFVVESAQYLQRLDRGEVTFGTLAGKAQQSDKVPMDADFMPGFTPDARTPGSNFYEDFTRVSFHFWYRGNPEVVPFARQALRNIHGVDSTALYYQPGLRTIRRSAVRPAARRQRILERLGHSTGGRADHLRRGSLS